MNTSYSNTICVKTKRKEFHRLNIYGLSAIAEPLVNAVNVRKRRKWYNAHKDWTSYHWKSFRRLDELAFTLFPNSGEFTYGGHYPRSVIIHVLMTRVKGGGRSVIVRQAYHGTLQASLTPCTIM